MTDRIAELIASGRAVIASWDEAKLISNAGVMAAVYPKSSAQINREGQEALDRLRAALAKAGERS